jgi:hypothetical protein
MVSLKHSPKQWCIQHKIDPMVYFAWLGMKQRCNNPHNPAYPNYGGRGIKVCKRWENEFRNFEIDMGPHPGRGWSLERKNNNGNYTSRNCIWATRTIQNRNSRHVRLTVRDIKQIRKLFRPGMGSGNNRGGLTLAAIAKRLGVSIGAVAHVAYGRHWIDG